MLFNDKSIVKNNPRNKLKPKLIINPKELISVATYNPSLKKFIKKLQISQKNGYICKGFCNVIKFFWKSYVLLIFKLIFLYLCIIFCLTSNHKHL
jgi:hypothetical protein